MKHNSLLKNLTQHLDKSERELAKQLGLSVAGLRLLDDPVCPHHLRLAAAALILDIDPDATFRNAFAARASRDSLPSCASPSGPTSKVDRSHVALLDPSFDD